MCTKGKTQTTCQSAQPDQSMMGALWVAKGTKYLQPEHLDADQTADAQTDFNLQLASNARLADKSLNQNICCGYSKEQSR